MCLGDDATWLTYVPFLVAVLACWYYLIPGRAASHGWFGSADAAVFLTATLAFAAYFGYRAGIPAQRIPEAVVIAQFGGLMAGSPRIFDTLVRNLARGYGTGFPETREYVFDVLKRAPPSFD